MKRLELSDKRNHVRMIGRIEKVDSRKDASWENDLD